MFDDITDRHVNAGTPSPADVPDVLYHYTDAAGLKGMLSSGKIWATDYRFLNDKSEIAHTEDIISELIAERVATSKNTIVSKLYSRLLSGPTFSSKYPTILFSLSEEADSLSQWRGYARDGQGYTIGFSGEALLEASSDETELDIRKVVYDPERQRRCLRLALNDIEKILLSESKKKSFRETKALSEAEFAARFITLAQSIYNKHHSFASEAEWRLATVAVSAEDQAMVKTRARGAELVPYMEMILSPDGGKLPIKSIGIGPGFSNDNQKVAVESLCREHGYSPAIYSADSPFRRG